MQLWMHMNHVCHQCNLIDRMQGLTLLNPTGGFPHDFCQPWNRDNLLPLPEVFSRSLGPFTLGNSVPSCLPGTLYPHRKHNTNNHTLYDPCMHMRMQAINNMQQLI